MVMRECRWLTGEDDPAGVRWSCFSDPQINPKASAEKLGRSTVLGESEGM
jgi:hypothetical protein